MGVKALVETDEHGLTTGLAFFCPGCKRQHRVHIGSTGWTWNGNPHAPTINPSVLVRSGHYARVDQKPGNCYCDYQERYPQAEPLEWSCVRCHSFIREGMIQFLDDSTHALKGETVLLPEQGDGNGH